MSDTSEIRILVLHGPNLNLLGRRHTQVYGRTTLAEINTELQTRARARGALLDAVQSNHEGELVTRIQEAEGRYEALLINAAAYTHTSIAIRDALEAVAVPAIEVHVSNIFAREPFRNASLLAPVCVGQISGFGAQSYYLGLDAALAHVKGLKSPAP